MTPVEIGPQHFKHPLDALTGRFCVYFNGSAMDGKTHGLEFRDERKQAWRHVTEAGSGLGDIEVADIETSKDG